MKQLTSFGMVVGTFALFCTIGLPVVTQAAPTSTLVSRHHREGRGGYYYHDAAEQRWRAYMEEKLAEVQEERARLEREYEDRNERYRDWSRRTSDRRRTNRDICITFDRSTLFCVDEDEGIVIGGSSRNRRHYPSSDERSSSRDSRRYEERRELTELRREINALIREERIIETKLRRGPTQEDLDPFLYSY
jgi:hypothetical protein